MTSRQKILDVLRDIKHESEISPDPDLVKFRFNTILGPGILQAEQQKIILKKLVKSGVIELVTSIDNYYEIEIRILPKFSKEYFWYSITSMDDNTWNIVNPFWLLWQLIIGIYFILKWFWGKNKTITVIATSLGGLLIYDWVLAWKNLKILLTLLNIL